jgi:hypothetical protein
MHKDSLSDGGGIAKKAVVDRFFIKQTYYIKKTCGESGTILLPQEGCYKALSNAN